MVQGQTLSQSSLAERGVGHEPWLYDWSTESLELPRIEMEREDNGGEQECAGDQDLGFAEAKLDINKDIQGWR